MMKLNAGSRLVEMVRLPARRVLGLCLCLGAAVRVSAPPSRTSSFERENTRRAAAGCGELR